MKPSIDRLKRALLALSLSTIEVLGYWGMDAGHFLTYGEERNIISRINHFLIFNLLVFLVIVTTKISTLTTVVFLTVYCVACKTTQVVADLDQTCYKCGKTLTLL